MLQLMGIQAYRLRSEPAQTESPELASQAADLKPAAPQPSVEIKAALQPDTTVVQDKPETDVPQIETAADSRVAAQASRDTGCEYLWSASEQLVIFGLSEAGFEPDHQQLFASISQVLNTGAARSGIDRWQPLAGKSSNRTRTLRMLLSNLVQPAADGPVLLLLGAEAGVLWSEQDWDLLQGSSQPAEPPFSGLRFGPALEEMVQRPYLKAQLWQLARDLVPV